MMKATQVCSQLLETTPPSDCEGSENDGLDSKKRNGSFPIVVCGPEAALVPLMRTNDRHMMSF